MGTIEGKIVILAEPEVVIPLKEDLGSLLAKIGNADVFYEEEQITLELESEVQSPDSLIEELQTILEEFSPIEYRGGLTIYYDNDTTREWTPED